MDKGKDLPVFPILEAMKILDLTCQKVKSSTIQQNFEKTTEIYPVG